MADDEAALALRRYISEVEFALEPPEGSAGRGASIAHMPPPAANTRPHYTLISADAICPARIPHYIRLLYRYSRSQAYLASQPIAMPFAPESRDYWRYLTRSCDIIAFTPR